MVPVDKLIEIADGLAEVEPRHDYAQRASALIAAMVNAAGYRLEHPPGHVVACAGAAPTNEAALCLPLRRGREHLGTLYITPTEGRMPSDEALERLRWAVRMLARGLDYSERLVAPGSQESIQETLDKTPLTPREKEVVTLLVGGASTREILEATGLTLSTVNTYMKRIFSKLNVHSRVELVAKITGASRTSRRPTPKISDVFAKYTSDAEEAPKKKTRGE